MERRGLGGNKLGGLGLRQVKLGKEVEPASVARERQGAGSWERGGRGLFRLPAGYPLGGSRLPAARLSAALHPDPSPHKID